MAATFWSHTEVFYITIGSFMYLARSPELSWPMDKWLEKHDQSIYQTYHYLGLLEATWEQKAISASVTKALRTLTIRRLSALFAFLLIFI